MIYKYFVISFLIIFLQSTGTTQEQTKLTPLPGMRGTPVNLPDISVVGDLQGKISTNENDHDRNKILVQEIEIAIQGYLYPEIKTDIFFAFHREENQEVNTELEETYVNFLKLFAGINGKLGKMLLNFGKLNKLHSEQWQFVKRPKVLTNFLGEHGLVAEGFSLGYLLPISFFSQIDFGIYNIPGTEKPKEFSLTDEVYTARVWNSFSISEIQELEIGISGVSAKGPDYFKKQGDVIIKTLDNVKIIGLDITYKFWPSTYQRLIFQNELLYLTREVAQGKFERTGFYNYLGYKLNKYTETGLLYDYLETLDIKSDISSQKETMSSVSGIITKCLTETTKFRFQYTHNFKPNSQEVFLQFIFGIGPHSHTLE